MQIEIEPIGASAALDRPCGSPLPPEAAERDGQREIEADEAVDRPKDRDDAEDERAHRQ